MEIKITDNPKEFFDDLEELFQEPKVKKFMENYIYYNVDSDIFITCFILYFMMHIYFPDHDKTKLLEQLLKSKNIVKIIEFINFIPKKLIK